MMIGYEKLNTPCYIIDKLTLDNGIENLKNALDFAWGNYIIGYSYKTNSLPWLIEYFKNRGCFAEVVSDDEYELAKSIGINSKRIIYNGIAKSKESFIECVRNGAIVNIDAEYEIDWLNEVNEIPRGVGIRVNFDLESRCPGTEQNANDGGRFGFCYENGELKKAIDRITSTGVRVEGIHLHKSSKTRMPDVYKAIAEIAVEIGDEYNLDLSYIDIGGGFFGGLKTKPPFPEYFNMISEVLKRRYDPNKTVLIVEPGNALVASSIEYVTRVLDIKKTKKTTFVTTDGSRIHVDPLMTKKTYSYDIYYCDNQVRDTIDRQVIAGFTCMENDRLFEINDGIRLFPGDRIVYKNVGAYTMCLAPLFIKWYPDVYLHKEDVMETVQYKWTYEEYKQKKR